MTHSPVSNEGSPLLPASTTGAACPGDAAVSEGIAVPPLPPLPCNVVQRRAATPHNTARPASSEVNTVHASLYDPSVRANSFVRN